MAEGIARSLLASGTIEGLDREELLIASAGVAAAEGMPPSPETMDILRARGIEEFSRSIQLTPEMVSQADLVLTMTQSHLQAIKAQFRLSEEDAECLHLLDPDRDVIDPIGQGPAAYEQAAEIFDKVIPVRLKELLA